MTIFMTPKQKPFYAGTYFPRHGRYGQPGLIELAERIAQLWKDDRDTLLRYGDRISAALTAQKEKSGEPRSQLLQRAYGALHGLFDSQWGGFGAAPKFPTPHNLLFLMQYGSMEIVDITLTAMAKGGIFDQIGGGFSRYSTDEMWLTPHFEKMLYDNALLIIAYSEAFERTQNPFYAEVVSRTADYILRELRAPEGGCYCGQDADSDGVEGGYYTFTPAELEIVLGEAEGKSFCRAYGITERMHIPNLINTPGEPWERARLQRVYDYRRSRMRLHTDDKVLLSWNAWTIIAFVKSAHLPEAMAIRDFIERSMTDEENRLYLRYRDGEAANAGQLDDYAVYALALLTLYRATLDVQYLEAATLRTRQMLNFFEDEKGGFFLTSHDAERLIDRPKETYDGAIPSGNSVAAMVLEILAQLTGETFWREAADRQMRFIAGQAEDYPAGHCFAMLAIDRALHPGRELIVCGNILPGELFRLHGNDLNILYKSSENAERLASCAPFTADYPVPSEGMTGYLCENGCCRRSGADVSELLD